MFDTPVYCLILNITDSIERYRFGDTKYNRLHFSSTGNDPCRSNHYKYLFCCYCTYFCCYRYSWSIFIFWFFIIIFFYFLFCWYIIFRIHTLLYILLLLRCLPPSSRPITIVTCFKNQILLYFPTILIILNPILTPDVPMYPIRIGKSLT